MKLKMMGASSLALSAALFAGATQAADTSDGTVAQVIVTGTRVTGMKAADSAAPIEMVGKDALTHTGSVDLASALATAVPSLNVQANGGDAAALTVQAALRGLSPNDTLVLVDGKRRHTTANLAVDGGSPYSGAATVDLSFIPVGSIDHIEVLQDGAAAQYGTDAIAGVVNIILKNSSHGGSASVSGGEYYEGDGQSGSWSLNRGFDLGDKGFFNVTVEQRTHAYSEQGTGDRRLQSASGAITTTGVNAAGVVNASGYPRENKLNGDPAYNIVNGFLNAGYDLTSDIQAYAFGSYGERSAQHYENYRVPTKVSGTTSTGVKVYPFPYGFDPSEQFKETDYSGTLGIKGTLEGWKWDLATNYGQDHDRVATINSANAQLFPVLQGLSATPIIPQRNFNDGAFINTEWSTTLDLDKEFMVGLATPLNVALGVEQRRDVFSIVAGEPSSYYGAGAQSFTGYTPQDQGSNTRTNYGAYVDFSVSPITGLQTDLAGRYEHYSDFGDTEVGKFTARYDFSPLFALRGTVSSGFRAPTLAEEFYSGTNVSPTSADVQLPPNSAAAQLAGFDKLKPEKSNNYSLGFVAHPMPKLQITGDIYQIDLRDRIVVSGFIFGSEAGCPAAKGCVTPPATSTNPNPTPVVSQGVLDAITARGVTLDSGLSYAGISVFTNGANTRTQGAELTANYASDFAELGHVDWSAGLNYNSTKIAKLDPLPAAVTNTLFGQTTLLNKSSQSALTTSTPKEKLILNAVYTYQKWTVDLRETFYGSASEWVSLDGSGTGAGAFEEKIGVTGITDLDVAYKVTPALKLEGGANNLFDQTPPKVPLYSGRPTNGANVYNVPYGFAAWGSNGGYYFVRATFTF